MNINKSGIILKIYRKFQANLIGLEYEIFHIVEKIAARNLTLEKIDFIRDCSALIKTFERGKTVKRCVSSLKYYFPNMEIIVVDDSKEPADLEGVKLIRAPYKSGVSFGRNLGLNSVNTKYFLLLDDDMYITWFSGIRKALDLMRTNSYIDIMGGKVIDLPFWRSRNYYGCIKIEDGYFKVIKKSKGSINEMPICDYVLNFFLGKTESIKKILWDDNLYTLDHEDFFYRAKDKLVTVYNNELITLHRTSEINKTYSERRTNIDPLRKYLEEKHQIKFVYEELK